MISGDVSLEADDDAHEITVIASATKKAKCVRCWPHHADVGNAAAHPQLCERCVSNIEEPRGDRQWFWLSRPCMDTSERSEESPIRHERTAAQLGLTTEHGRHTKRHKEPPFNPP